MVQLEKVAFWKTALAVLASAFLAYFLLRLTSDSWTEKEIQVLLTMGFYLLLSVSVWMVLKNARIPLGVVLGAPAERFSLAYLFFAVCSLLLLTFGSFYLLHYALLFHFPDYVSSVISEGIYTRPSESHHYWGLNIAMLMVWTLLVPVVEEVVFRGLLFSRWRSKVGHFPALVLSSLAFSVLHFDLLGNFVFSLVMTVFLLRTGTFLIPIFCHALNNLVGMAIEPFLALVGYEDFRWTLDIFKANVWIGALCFVASLPFIFHFFRENRGILKNGV